TNATGEIEGFVKIIAAKESNKILGVHIIGAEAGTLIGTATLAMANKLSVDQLLKGIYAHPTVSEAIFEAGLNVLGNSIHL
ncbi:dihydrolipoyl dehydrogenase, partial [Candidatus Margulisiibacteriota bacterium]